MEDPTEGLRALIVSQVRGRTVDPERLLPLLLECFQSGYSGERTFTETPAVTPSQKVTMEKMTIDEKEVFLECAQVIISNLKRSIARDMN